VKKNWNKAIVIGVVAIAIIAWLVWGKTPHAPPAPALPPPPAMPVATVPSNAPVAEAKPHPMRSNLTKRPSEFTEEEKQEFTNLFATKLKPSAEKWFSVYGNRAPFNLDDLTADKFVSQLGRERTNHRAYTFVMGDVTFGIQEFHGETYVNYLASRRGVGAMNTPPKLAGPADLSMPVTREQVLDLVEADSGKRFPPNEVTLTPTGESGSLMGGVDVEVGKEVNNPDYTIFSTTSQNFSFVFGPDGKLVYYERTP
jgi:hypothetical protein